MGEVKDGNGSRGERKPINARQLRAIANLFSVLSDGNRLQVLRALQQGPLSTDELVESTGSDMGSVVEQLGLLLKAGVISRQQENGREIYLVEMPVALELCELVCHGVPSQTAD